MRILQLLILVPLVSVCSAKSFAAVLHCKLEVLEEIPVLGFEYQQAGFPAFDFRNGVPEKQITKRSPLNIKYFTGSFEHFNYHVESSSSANGAVLYTHFFEHPHRMIWFDTEQSCSEERCLLDIHDEFGKTNKYGFMNQTADSTISNVQLHGMLAIESYPNSGNFVLPFFADKIYWRGTEFISDRGSSETGFSKDVSSFRATLNINSEYRIDGFGTPRKEYLQVKQKLTCSI